MDLFYLVFFFSVTAVPIWEIGIGMNEKEMLKNPDTEKLKK